MHKNRRSIGFLALPALLVRASIYAGSLGSTTIAAWDEYVESAKMSNEQRSVSAQGFLWADEAPGRSARVRAGEIVVAAGGQHCPKRVPSGLIHDWVGAAFIPGADLDDVLGVVRDYARYKEWFQPAVADSRFIALSEGKDGFSMVLVNKSFFKRMALDTDHEASFVRIDSRRAYGISRSTRIQEINDYGSSDQHLLPEGEGTGMIWRLMSITRYLERDGGVYIELQAIGLSRDIPASLRWMVEPIVRSVSRTSLSTSLRQTVNATLSNRSSAAANQPTRERTLR
jgi:hypothetical protein